MSTMVKQSKNLAIFVSVLALVLTFSITGKFNLAYAAPVNVDADYDLQLINAGDDYENASTLDTSPTVKYFSPYTQGNDANSVFAYSAYTNGTKTIDHLKYTLGGNNPTAFTLHNQKTSDHIYGSDDYGTDRYVLENAFSITPAPNLTAGSYTATLIVTPYSSATRAEGSFVKTYQFGVTVNPASFPKQHNPQVFTSPSYIDYVNERLKFNSHTNLTPGSYKIVEADTVDEALASLDSASSNSYADDSYENIIPGKSYAIKHLGDATHLDSDPEFFSLPQRKERYTEGSGWLTSHENGKYAVKVFAPFKYAIKDSSDACSATSRSEFIDAPSGINIAANATTGQFVCLFGKASEETYSGSIGTVDTPGTPFFASEIFSVPVGDDQPVSMDIDFDILKDGSSTQSQVFDPKTYGYDPVDSASFDIKDLDSEDIDSLNIQLVGDNSDEFELTDNTSSFTSLSSDATFSNAFTVQPKLGLNAGDYLAEVVITASNTSLSLSSSEYLYIHFHVNKAKVTTPAFANVPAYIDFVNEKFKFTSAAGTLGRWTIYDARTHAYIVGPCLLIDSDNIASYPVIPGDTYEITHCADESTYPSANYQNSDPQILTVASKPASPVPGTDYTYTESLYSNKFDTVVVNNTGKSYQYSIDHGENWQDANPGQNLSAELPLNPNGFSSEFIYLREKATNGSGANDQHFSSDVVIQPVFPGSEVPSYRIQVEDSQTNTTYPNNNNEVAFSPLVYGYTAQTYRQFNVINAGNQSISRYEINFANDFTDEFDEIINTANNSIDPESSISNAFQIRPKAGLAHGSYLSHATITPFDENDEPVDANKFDLAFRFSVTKDQVAAPVLGSTTNYINYETHKLLNKAATSTTGLLEWKHNNSGAWSGCIQKNDGDSIDITPGETLTMHRCSEPDDTEHDNSADVVLVIPRLNDFDYNAEQTVNPVWSDEKTVVKVLQDGYGYTTDATGVATCSTNVDDYTSATVGDNLAQSVAAGSKICLIQFASNNATNYHFESRPASYIVRHGTGIRNWQVVAISPDTNEEVISYTFPGTAVFGRYSNIAPAVFNVANFGNQNIDHITVALSGENADEFTIPSHLNNLGINEGGSLSNAFSIKPVDGLAAGTYTADVTVTPFGGNPAIAEPSGNYTFTVVFVVSKDKMPTPTFGVSSQYIDYINEKLKFDAQTAGWYKITPTIAESCTYFATNSSVNITPDQTYQITRCAEDDSHEDSDAQTWRAPALPAEPELGTDYTIIEPTFIDEKTQVIVNAGSSKSLEYSINSGSTWTPATPGNNIAASATVGTNVLLRVKASNVAGALSFAGSARTIAIVAGTRTPSYKLIVSDYNTGVDYADGDNQPETAVFDNLVYGYTDANWKVLNVKNIGDRNVTKFTITTDGDFDANFDIFKRRENYAINKDETLSQAFDIRPKAGLSAGTYTGTVTLNPFDKDGNLVPADAFSLPVSVTVSKAQMPQPVMGITPLYIDYITKKFKFTTQTGLVGNFSIKNNGGSWSNCANKSNGDQISITPGSTLHLIRCGDANYDQSNEAFIRIPNIPDFDSSVEEVIDPIYTDQKTVVRIHSEHYLFKTYANQTTQCSSDAPMYDQALVGVNLAQTIAAGGRVCLIQGASNLQNDYHFDGKPTYVNIYQGSATRDYKLSVFADENDELLDGSLSYKFPGTAVYNHYSNVSQQSFTVKNTGNQSIDHITVALSGRNANAFTIPSQLNNLDIDIDDEIQNVFSVKPVDGLAAGTYTADVTVTPYGGNPATAEPSGNYTFTVVFTVSKDKMSDPAFGSTNQWIDFVNEKLMFNEQTAGWYRITPSIALSCTYFANGASADITPAETYQITHCPANDEQNNFDESDPQDWAVPARANTPVGVSINDPIIPGGMATLTNVNDDMEYCSDNCGLFAGSWSSVTADADSETGVPAGRTYFVRYKAFNTSVPSASGSSVSHPNFKSVLVGPFIAKNMYSVTWEPGNGLTSGDVTGGQAGVLQGANVTTLPTAPAIGFVRNGWTFEGWYNASTHNSTAQTCNGTVAQNITIYSPTTFYGCWLDKTAPTDPTEADIIADENPDTTSVTITIKAITDALDNNNLNYCVGSAEMACDLTNGWVKHNSDFTVTYNFTPNVDFAISLRVRDDAGNASNHVVKTYQYHEIAYNLTDGTGNSNSQYARHNGSVTLRNAPTQTNASFLYYCEDDNICDIKDTAAEYIEPISSDRSLTAHYRFNKPTANDFVISVATSANANNGKVTGVDSTYEWAKKVTTCNEITNWAIGNGTISNISSNGDTFCIRRHTSASQYTQASEIFELVVAKYTAPVCNSNQVLQNGKCVNKPATPSKPPVSKPVVPNKPQVSIPTAFIKEVTKVNSDLNAKRITFTHSDGKINNAVLKVFVDYSKLTGAELKWLKDNRVDIYNLVQKWLKWQLIAKTPCQYNAKITVANTKCKKIVYTSLNKHVVKVNSKTGKKTQNGIGIGIIKKCTTSVTFSFGVISKATKCSKKTVVYKKIKFKIKRQVISDLKNVKSKTSRKNIKWLDKVGVTECANKNGKPIKKCDFYPKHYVTREMMAEFLWKIIGFPDRKGNIAKYTKIYFTKDKTMRKKTSETRYSTIQWLANNGNFGVIKANAKFNPTKKITRAQLQKWITLFVGKAPAKKLVKTLPKKNINREKIANWLVKFYKYIIKYPAK